MNLSLRQIMVLKVSLAITLILGLSGSILAHLISSDMQGRFTTSLYDLAKVLEPEAVVENGLLTFDIRELNQNVLTEKDFIQLSGPDGCVLYQSSNLEAQRIPDPPTRPGKLDIYSHDLTDGTRLGCIHMAFHPFIENPNNDEDVSTPAMRDTSIMLSLTVGRETMHLNNTIFKIRLVVFFVAVATLLTLTFTLSSLIGTALAPVEDLAKGIAGLEPPDWGRGLETGDLPPEFHPIVDRLNSLLYQVRSLIEREKTFTADFSHEIRTPLAGLKSSLEVALFRPRSIPEYRQSLEECLKITDSMQAITEAMLTLKRIESGAIVLNKLTFSLNDLVESLANEIKDTYTDENMEIVLQLEPGLVVESDRSLCEIVFRNIFENAMAHGHPSGPVIISGVDSDIDVIIEVCNPVLDLDPDITDQLKSRFRKGDRNRTANGNHVGLGLAIVDGIMETLGGALSIQVDPSGYFRVRVIFQSPCRLSEHDGYFT